MNKMERKVVPKKKGKLATRTCMDDWIKNFTPYKRSQEEMVGFAIIIVIVAVILVVFLWFFLSNSNRGGIESYEVESFIQSVLQVTTECQGSGDYYDIRELIYECYNDRECENSKDSCEVLNSTLEEALKGSFLVGENRPINGYKFNVIVRDEPLISIENGNFTGNSKGSLEEFRRSGSKIETSLTVYTKFSRE